MKKITTFILLMMFVFALSACGSDEKDDNAGKKDEAGQEVSAEDFEKEKEEFQGLSEEDLVKECFKDLEKGATEDEFIKFYSYTKFFDFNEYDGTLAYPKNFIKATAIVKESDAEAPSPQVMMEHFIDSEYAPSRAYAVAQMDYDNNLDENEKKIILDMFEKEKDPNVLLSMTFACRNNLHDDEIWTQFLKMSDHENPFVRAQTAFVGDVQNRDIDGAVDLIIKLLGDEDAFVRERAARYSGKLNDDAVIPALQAILANPDDVKNHGYAAEGLCDLWYVGSSYDANSEAAYNAYMDFLRTTPRADNVPDWYGVNKLVTTVVNEDQYNEWYQNATYLNVDELIQVLYDIVADPATGYNTKKAAMQATGIFGTDEQLEALRAPIESWDNEVFAESLISDFEAEVAK